VTDYDPRVVDLYDEDNPDGPDHDFYRALAEEVSAESVLDLGCGTGILTVTLVREGRDVVGVDPSAAMLAYARRRTGADAVAWIHGDSRSIPLGTFDYAVMSGNVAQHISEVDWDCTLRDLRQALRVGGILAFESRNPSAGGWVNWASGERTKRETPHGELIQWMDVTETAPGTVELTAHNLFAETTETVTETQVLVFRDRNTLETQLKTAGFVVENVYGDWNRGPVTEKAPIMIFVARAR
jgi:SAM-dependent methyltransferase